MPPVAQGATPRTVHLPGLSSLLATYARCYFSLVLIPLCRPTIACWVKKLSQILDSRKTGHPTVSTKRVSAQPSVGFPRGNSCIVDFMGSPTVEAYEALVPIYEWLGASYELVLLYHSPHRHGICEGDIHSIVDFAGETIFGRKPASGKAFNQIGNPNLTGFDWKAPSPITDRSARSEKSR